MTTISAVSAELARPIAEIAASMPTGGQQEAKLQSIYRAEAQEKNNNSFSYQTTSNFQKALFDDFAETAASHRVPYKVAQTAYESHLARSIIPPKTDAAPEGPHHSHR